MTSKGHVLCDQFWNIFVETENVILKGAERLEQLINQGNFQEAHRLEQTMNYYIEERMEMLREIEHKLDAIDVRHMQQRFKRYRQAEGHGWT